MCVCMCVHHTGQSDEFTCTTCSTVVSSGHLYTAAALQAAQGKTSSSGAANGGGGGSSQTPNIPGYTGEMPHYTCSHTWCSHTYVPGSALLMGAVGPVVRHPMYQVTQVRCAL